LNHFFKHILYSNAFVALAGGFFAFHDALTFGFQYSIYGAIFLTVSTWLSYQMPLINCFILSKNIPVKAKDIWFVKHKKAMTALTVMLLMVAFGCFVQLKPHRQLVFLSLASISMWYVMPMSLSKYSLRNIPYLKIFLIAGSWAGLSVFWWRPFNHEALLLFLIRLIIVLVITLPFDIRDIDDDKKNQLKTIPIFLGHQKTMTLIFTLLCIAICLAQFLRQTPVFDYCTIALATVALSFYHLKRSDFYYYVVLDGIFIVQGIMVTMSGLLIS
jgi:4-hydroxybenzoate polyprenyltransferase